MLRRASQTLLGDRTGARVLLVGMLCAFMTNPGQTAGVSAFVDPIASTLDLSRSFFSSLYVAATMASAVCMPLVGRIMDRLGPRSAATLAASALAFACLVMAVAQAPWSLFLGLAAIRMTGAGALNIVSAHVVSLHFTRDRGLALSLVGLGVAFGAAVFPSIAAALTDRFGWRSAYVGLGIAVALAALAASMLLPSGRKSVRSTGPEVALGGWTPAQARATVAFWYFAAAAFLSNALGTGLVLHHFAIMAESGIGRVAAAAALAPVGISQAIGALCIGWLLDRFGPLRVAPAALGLLAAATVLAGHVEDGALAWGYGAILGLALASITQSASFAWPHYFGLAHAGEIRGTAAMISVTGAATGPLLAVLAASLGGYAPALYAVALAPVALGLAGLAVRSPSVAARPPSAPPA